VTVACPTDGLLRTWAFEAGARVEVVDLRREPGLTDIRAFWRVRRLIRRAEVAAFLSSKAGALGRAAVVSVCNPPACVFSPHGWSWLVGGRLAGVYRLIEQMLGSVGRIVAVSDEEAKLGRAGLRGHVVIDVIENGIDTRKFAPEGVRAPRRPEPLVLVVGRLCHQKGQDRALEILARMRASSVRLRFVGDGDQLALRDQADALGLGDRVEFIGEADPAPHYRCADVVLVPSRYDGQSLALLEALSSGCAVVATDAAGVAAARGVARIVPVDDLGGAAHQLDELIASAETRASMKVAARERALENYDIRRCRREWREYLTSLAEGGRRSHTTLVLRMKRVRQAQGSGGKASVGKKRSRCQSACGVRE